MDQATQLFSLFREIGIIQQLSGTMFARRLPDGLHPSHFALLSNLIRLGDGKTPQALASAFQVPKATMTNTLSVLGGLGLIDVRPNPDDKRSKLVFATDAGRAFHDDAVAGMGPVMADLFPLIRDVDVEAALTELQKLRVILDNNRDI
ncbi:MarR family winged helix-turn-helix transcriptional regulator [Yoonia sp. 208BN28-4]|uniref:MarR family winged helix-turn-helix transcriptional regulator n=1 Tax=Yoonia sp. 208BN28-4 TaxID=3126505 RepID=UPI0030B767EB